MLQLGLDLTPITQNRVRLEVINLTVRSFNYATETSDRPDHSKRSLSPKAKVLLFISEFMQNTGASITKNPHLASLQYHD